MTPIAPGRLALLLGLAFLAATVLVPVGVVVGAAWTGAARAGTLAPTLADPVTERALANSLTQGAFGAAAALLLGFPAGIVLGRWRFPLRRAVLGGLLVAFLLPNLVMVEGVVTLFGDAPGPLRGLDSGLPGVLAVDALYNAPMVALLTALGCASADARLEEDVRVLGGGAIERFRRVWGPPALTGAAAAGALTFALSALAFAAPIAIGGPAQYTLEARIWSLDQQLVAPGAAGVVAGLALLVLAGPALAYVVLVGRLTRRSRGAEAAPQPPRLGGAATWAGFAALAGLVVLEAGVVGAALVRLLAPGSRATGGGSALADLFGPAIDAHLGLPTVGALGNSAFFAGTATGLALLAGLALVYGARAVPRRSAAVVTGLPFLSVLVSPIVLALALYATFGATLGGATTLWVLIVLAQATLALPFVASGLYVALARVPRALGEAAQVLGASPGLAFRDVELPAARRGVGAAALLGLSVALGEFAATFFLAPPQDATLTVELYHLVELRWVPEAWALGGLLALVTTAALVAAAYGGARGDR